MVSRVVRLNSLLREVLSDVIRKEVRNPKLPELVSVTYVEISKDLKHAKVYISVIGDESQRTAAIEALTSASGFIGTKASKLVVMRYFPTLSFHLDETVDHQMHIDSLIKEIQEERSHRQQHSADE